jgi:hypothetical protein
MNRKLHEVASANGGAVVGEEYHPIDHADWAATVERINSSGAHVVFNTTVPPGCFPFLEALCASGFTKRGGRIITTYWDENVTSVVPSEQIEGAVRVHRLLPVGQRSVQPGAARPLQRALPGWTSVQRRQRVHGHVPRPEALGGGRQRGRLTRAGGRRGALDHAKIAEGPGGPAEMVPGQHHVRMNMYIAEVRAGAFTVRPEDEAALLAQRGQMIDALQRAFTAALAAWLTKQDDGSWLDVIPVALSRGGRGGSEPNRGGAGGQGVVPAHRGVARDTTHGGGRRAPVRAAAYPRRTGS